MPVGCGDLFALVDFIGMLFGWSDILASERQLNCAVPLNGGTDGCCLRVLVKSQSLVRANSWRNSVVLLIYRDDTRFACVSWLPKSGQKLRLCLDRVRKYVEADSLFRTDLRKHPASQGLRCPTRTEWAMVHSQQATVAHAQVILVECRIELDWAVWVMGCSLEPIAVAEWEIIARHHKVLCGILFLGRTSSPAAGANENVVGSCLWC